MSMLYNPCVKNVVSDALAVSIVSDGRRATDSLHQQQPGPTLQGECERADGDG